MGRLTPLLLLLGLATQARATDEAHQIATALAGRVWHDDAPLADGSFEMTCVIDELDSKGNVTKHLVLQHRRTFRSGAMHEELLAARENGVDVLGRQRKAEAHPVRRGTTVRWSLDDALSPPIPFLAEPPSHYQLVAESPSDTARPRRMGYAPRVRVADRRCASGHVELDAQDGLPLRLVFTPIPLPKMIRTLTTTVNYGRLSGLAIPESTESIGEGGLLFIKKRFRVRMTYQHWGLAAAATPASPLVSDNSHR